MASLCASSRTSTLLTGLKRVKVQVQHALIRSASTSATPNTSYLSATHPDEPPSSSSIRTTLDRHARYVLSTYARPPIIISHGKGLKVWDTQGREYLDLSAGIAVNALGHSDEGVAKLLGEQARKLIHGSNLYHNEWAGELAQLLVEKTIESGGMQSSPSSTPGSPKSPATPEKSLNPNSTPSSSGSSGLKVFFSNSGTESNEGAIKFVRKWGKAPLPPTASEEIRKKGGENRQRTDIVSFTNGFHGRSMGALSATFQEKYQKPFAPLVPGFKPGKLNDVEGVRELVDENVCGVIVEPIQGEGGILEATEDFLRALRKRCDEVGALLIFDEIQCGLGRTGYLWAHSSLPPDCHPDIVTMAKPLANGIPIGAIMMNDKVADVIKLGDHGTTFGGGALQTCIAHHVLSRISSESFLSSVRRVSGHLRGRLSNLVEFFPNIIAGPTRGRGLILGVPLKNDELVGKAVRLCRERGLLLLSCGNSTIRWVPSLTITDEEVDKACDIFESALSVLNKELKA